MFCADDLDVVTKCISMSDHLGPRSILNMLEIISLTLEFGYVRALRWEAQIDSALDTGQTIQFSDCCLFERWNSRFYDAGFTKNLKHKLDDQIINSLKRRLMCSNKSGDSIGHQCLLKEEKLVILGGKQQMPERVSGSIMEFYVSRSSRKAIPNVKNPILCIAPILNKALDLFMATASPRWDGLTKREMDVLRWAAWGKNAWEIGKILQISQRTVNFHLQNSYQKLGVANRSQALVKATKLGLLHSIVSVEVHNTRIACALKKT